MATQGVPTTAGRRKRLLISFVFLATVVGAFVALDGWLLVRLRIIAGDVFKSGDLLHPALYHSDAQDLRSISPRRLARFLSVPSKSIRTVVCLSLGDREPGLEVSEEKPDPAQWVGVAGRLLESAQTDSEEVVRRYAAIAARALPIVPNEDVETLFAFASAIKPNEEYEVLTLRASVLAKLAKWHPGQVPRIVALLEGWCSSDDLQTRRTGFASLFALAPSAPETLSAFRNAMEAGDPDRIGDSGWMLNHHPELIDEFLKGNEVQRRLLRAPAQRQAQSMAGRNAAQPQAMKPFNESQLRSIDADFETLLSEKSSTQDFASACRYFQVRPQGPALLLTHARRLSGSNRATLLFHATDRFRAASDIEPFLNDLKQWLQDKDEKVQDAAKRVLRGAHPLLDGLPASVAEPVREALRTFFKTHPKRTTIFDLEAIVVHRDRRDDDVDRLAAKVLEELSPTTAGGANGPQRQGSFGSGRLSILADESPELKDRPLVKAALAKQAEMAKASQRLVMPTAAAPGTPPSRSASP